MKDYYLILEVKQDATHEEIKQSYRRLARQYHPDLHQGHTSKAFEGRMQLLNEAADILLNEEKRAVYDKQLAIEKGQIQVETTGTYSPPPQYRKSTYPSNVALKEDIELKRLIIFFFVFAMLAAIFISIGIYNQFFKNKNNDFILPKNAVEYTNIELGMPITDVIALLGEPQKETEHLLDYGKYQVIVNNLAVSGWLDAGNRIPKGMRTKINLGEIVVGDSVDTLLDRYGNPDTYSDELAIYGNIVFYLKNNTIYKINIL